MKIHAIVLALLFPVSASAVHHHEFGTIKEEGGTVSHTFVLPAASSPQTILHAFPGCPCVKVDYPRQTVKAGEPINVTVIFDPEKQKGHFTKSVYLRLNDNRRDTLVITGTIERTRPLIDISGYP
ncbi:MAG: DUF1573 domain-containing protein, partial [Muribaculaceae bacterium]|nr:DUF1573 domain-containing protein [Muribaculaceae bacterium]